MIVLEENISEVEDFLNFWKKQLENRKMSWRVVSDPTYTKYFSQTDCFIWFKCRDSDAMTQEKFRDLQKSAFKQIGLPLNQKNDNPVPLHPQARFKDICSILWYGVNIAAKADVSPCCVDVDFDLKIGNLKINSLKEIYLGEEMKKLRLAHIGNNLQDYSVCRNCSFSHFAGPVCDNDIAAYIEGINS
jgi:radical SAM protein with 4Fe4S-binding SPASM domain